ncbi:MAG TPA: hypothetical protein DCP28_36290, partial [Cytophagales bacterium]|nr:hypothetical protein [Cytophagales bacterium]
MVSATTIPDGFNVKLRPEYLRSMSAEEFFCFCQDNPQLRLERSAEGEIIFMSPSGLDTGFAEGEIVGELIQWNRQKQLGRVSSPSGGYTLPNGAIRAADASFITFGRLEAVSAQDRKRFAPVVPNFVAEVVSPSDSLADQQAKMDEWIQNGVELG